MAPTGRPRRRVLALVVGLTAALVVGPASQAHAHAFLTGSNPADGGLLAQAPSELRLDFSESVVVDATSIDVVDGAGQHFAVSDLRLVADDPADTEEPVQLVAALPALPQNTYRVHWRTLSSDDLHRTEGVLAFGVGTAVTGVGVVDEAPRPAESALRWLLWLGLAGTLGALAIALLAGPSLTGVRRGRLARCGTASAVLMVVAGTALPVAQLGSARDALLAARTPAVGIGWGARVVAALLTAVLAAALLDRPLRRPGSRPLLGLLLVSVLAVPLASAWRGHLGATGSALLVVADVLHSTAAALWVGSVAMLLVVHQGRRGRRAIVPARAFAALAAGCLLVVAVSGLLLAGHGVATLTALARADYGRLVLLKGALLAVVLLLALVNHRHAAATGSAGVQGRRPLAAEAGVLAVLLAAAGTLAATAPANSPQWTPAPAPSRIASATVGDLQLALRVGPNSPGPAFVSVGVLQTRRPAPAPVSAVHVTLRRNGSTGPSGEATLQPDGSWVLPVQLPAAGPWQVQVAADRSGLPTTRWDTAWVVGGGIHGPPGRSLSGISRAAALVLALVAVGLLLAGGRRRPPTPRRFRDWRQPLLLGRRWRAGHAGDVVPSVVVLVLAGALWTPGSPWREDPRPAVQPVVSVASVRPDPVGFAATSAGGPSGALAEPPSPDVTLPASFTRPGWVGSPLPWAAVAGGTTAVPGAHWPALVGDGPVRLPLPLLQAYRAAAASSPSCRLPVSLLAAIGQVESGSLLGRRLDAAHRAVPAVLGPVLDGHGTAAVRDTDDGRLDGDRRWDRAVGPMQFIPGTWAVFGVDADGDGTADPQDVDDAAASAARYLCAGGRDLSQPAGVRSAVLSYNHSTRYLALVLAWQQRFAVGGVRAADRVPAPASSSPTPAASRPPPGPTSSPTTSVPRPVPSATATGTTPPTAAPTTSPTTAPSTAPTTSPTTNPTVVCPPGTVPVVPVTGTPTPTQTAEPTSEPTSEPTLTPPTADVTSDPGAVSNPHSSELPSDVPAGCTVPAAGSTAGPPWSPPAPGGTGALPSLPPQPSPA